jgi:hypothetical protein
MIWPVSRGFISRGYGRQEHPVLKGVTTDNGQTWTWTAITENSSVDNLRPIIPQWDEDHTALLWWRGNQTNSQNFDTAVVGLILSENESLGDVHYVDATTENTTHSNGSPLKTTSDSGPGATDNLWHIRSEAGNGGTVFTADDLTDSTAENSTLTVFGSPHQSYPAGAEDESYSSTAFVDSLGMPVGIDLINEMNTEAASEFGELSDVFGFGLNFDLASKTDTLTGMSGSPVLGDGLTGILCSASYHHPEYYKQYYPDVDASDAVVFHFFSTLQLANVP